MKDTTLETLTDPKAIDIASFDGTLDQRLAFCGTGEADPTEEEIELEEIVNQRFILSPRSLARSPSRLDPSAQKFTQITFKICLESGLVRREVARIETPQSAICEESILDAAVLDIRLYLLRRVLSPIFSPDRPI
jgi:hypothetical protein